MFLTARRFMYQQVYFHRTVRAIDLDLADVFGRVGPGDLRRRVAGRAAGGLRRPRRVRARSTRPPAGRAAWTSPADAPRGRPATTVAASRRRRLASDPAAPAELALRGRGPGRVRGGRASPTALIDEPRAGRARPGRDRPGDRRRPARPRAWAPSRDWRSRCATGRRTVAGRGARLGCPPTRSSAGATGGPAR